MKLGTKFALAFLATSAVPLALLVHTSRELWERDREVLARSAQSKAEAVLRDLRIRLEHVVAPPAGGPARVPVDGPPLDRFGTDEDVDVRELAKEAWLDAPTTGGVAAHAAAWLKAHPWYAHLLVFDARANLVWSDSTIQALHADPMLAPHIPTMLTGLLPLKAFDPPDGYVLSVDGSKQPLAGRFIVSHKRVEGDKVIYETPAVSVTDPPNWMADPTWARIGASIEVQDRQPDVVDTTSWCNSGTSAQFRIARKGQLAGHLRAIRHPRAVLADLQAFLARWHAAHPTYEVLAHMTVQTPASTEEYDAMRAPQTDVARLDAPAQYPVRGRSLQLASSADLPWRQFEIERNGEISDIWLPELQRRVVVTRTADWSCVAMGHEFQTLRGYLALAQPMSAVTAPLDARRAELYWRLLLVLAGTLGVAAALARWIARPVRELTAAAAHLARDAGPLPANGAGGDELGALVGAFGAMAERVEARAQAKNRELATQNEKLAQLNQIKSDWVAGLSHDLKTPLARIRGSAELLGVESQGLRQDLGEMLGAIVDNVDHLNGLVDKILAVSRLETEMPVLELARVSLGTLVQRVAARLAPALVLAADEPADRVAIDEGKIEQVVANLIDNALKYAPAGTPVELRLTGTPTHVELHVRDRGRGLAAADRDRVFEKFYRAPGSLPGAGLGLYLARTLAQMHGGFVRADSDGPGLGTTFVLGLPRET